MRKAKPDAPSGHAYQYTRLPGFYQRQIHQSLRAACAPPRLPRAPRRANLTDNVPDPAQHEVSDPAMSDLQRENHNLRRILEIVRRMAISCDLDELLTMIVEAACEVLDCDRATIFLYDAETDELFSRVAKGVEGIRFPAGAGIAGEAARTRRFINVPDAYADERFNPEVDRKTGYRTRSLLTFPLENIEGELIGVLQALNKRDGPFTAEDEELARLLAAQAGVALDRGRLLEEFAIKQRLQRDIDIAHEIQQALFPKQDPQVAGYDIAGWNRSADETGGDAYDFIDLPDGRLAIFLADATGHGIASALIIAQCRALLRALLSVTQNLRLVAAGVNNLLSADLADDRFVTAFVGILDPHWHTLEYIAAGQGPLIMITGERIETRCANALPLAILPHIDYDPPERFHFHPGDTLVLLTDGFYEAANAEKEQFGEERVIELIQQHRDLALHELIESLYRHTLSFTGSQPQADDLTAVLIRRQV